MTTIDTRFEAARLTDEEIWGLPTARYPVVQMYLPPPRYIADAATRKALDHEEARRKALAEALADMDGLFALYVTEQYLLKEADRPLLLKAQAALEAERKEAS